MVWLFPNRQLVFRVTLLFFDASLRRFSVTERMVIYYKPLFAIQLTTVIYMLIAQIGFMKKQFIYFIWLCGRRNNGHPKKTTYLGTCEYVTLQGKRDSGDKLKFFGFLNIYLLIWLHGVLVAYAASSLRHAGYSSLTRDGTRAPCIGSTGP